MVQQIGYKHITLAISAFLLILFISHILLSFRTDTLIDKKYLDHVNKLSDTTETLIKAKSDSILFLALALANDKRYIKSIQESGENNFELDKFSEKLKLLTSYKNVWVQVSDNKGISLYRSWTKKRGDDLSKIRIDIQSMIQSPEIKSIISTGIFDMTFKAMVPIVLDGKFMGTLEVIAKFNSIADQLLDSGHESVILVDKSYKAQIKKPFTKIFIDDYYVVNLNSSRENREYIKEFGLEKILFSDKAYIIDSTNNRLISQYIQKGIDGKPMGYFILFHPLDEIGFEDIYFFHYAFLGFISFIVLSTYLILVLNWVRYSKEKVELRSKLLESEVQEKDKKLKVQHKFLEEVINGVHDSVMVIDRDYNVLLANDRAKRFMKKSIIQDPEHIKCYEVSHHQQVPCDGQNHPCPLNRTFEINDHVKVVHEHLTASGERHFIELTTTPLYDEDNKVYAVIETGHDITEHLEIKERLELQKDALDYQAHYDSLTKLPNRVLFYDRLHQAIMSAKRNNEKVALLFIDLDHFKQINDSLGHHAGDAILVETAQRLTNMFRESDTVARLGGDEFTVILEHFDYIEEITGAVSELITKMQLPYNYENKQLYCGASIGISMYPDNGLDVQNLIKNADAAMYKSKESGRNTYSFYTDEMTTKAYDRIYMEAKLRQAIQDDSFMVYYQPQFNALTEQLKGFEALIRWKDDDGAFISPDQFIPLAEQTNLIVDIGKIVMKRVFKQVSRWKKDSMAFDKIAINISTQQLKSKSFLEEVQNLLKSTECNPEWIEFEITESYIMNDIDSAIKLLKKIEKLGIKISVDDFGTGYSSLMYLKQLPLYKLKIDRSFIDDIPVSDYDMTITKSIIDLASNMELEVIAEGVETEAQKIFLLENGCSLVQGYLYDRALPVKEINKKYN